MGFPLDYFGTPVGASMNNFENLKQNAAVNQEDIRATLAERGSRYGAFEDHARIAQNLQRVMRDTEGWDELASHQAQALTVIADKIARILNGDPDYLDNWHDIQGYAKLVEDILTKEQL